MRKKVTIFMLAVLCAVCLTVPAKAEDSSPDFDQYLEQEFIETMESDYMSMHYQIRDYRALGIEKPEPVYGAADLDSFREAAEAYDETLKELRSFNYEKLSRTQQVDYDALEFYFECARDLNKYPMVYDYFNPSYGEIDDILTNFTEFIFYEKQDIDDYLAVLKSVPDYLEEALEVTRIQAKSGFFLNDDMLDDAEEMIRNYTAKKENNELIVLFDKNMDSLPFISAAEKAAYKKRNREIVLSDVIPSYDHVFAELEKLRGSRNFEGGLYNYKNGGKEYYRVLARSKTSSTMPIEDQIEMLGEYLMDLIDEYEELYLAHPDIDDRFIDDVVKFRKPEEIIEYHRKHLENYPAGPEVQYRVDFLDESLANNSVVGYYMIPPVDDLVNNAIKINPHQADDYNELFSTLAHEGFPGHLYQNTWYMAQNPAKIRAADTLIGYSEGWGMYAESCAWEYAGLDEDVQKLHQIWLGLSYAEEAMVDLAVNGLGWDEDDLANYVYNLGMNSDYVVELIDYVIARPGMILPYGCGLMRFWNLRKEAMEKLGDRFDLLAFNTVLLSGGPRTFEAVEKDVDQYIQETLNGKKEQGSEAKPESGTSGSDKPSAKPASPSSTPQALEPSETGRPQAKSTKLPFVIGTDVFVLAAIGAWFVLASSRKKDPFE